MSDRLHWVGQGEQHLALLGKGKATKAVGKDTTSQKNNITASPCCNYGSILSYFVQSERL